MKGNFDAYVLCVTFGQNGPKLNGRLVYYSRNLWLRQVTIVTIMCRNDELSLTQLINAAHNCHKCVANIEWLPRETQVVCKLQCAYGALVATHTLLTFDNCFNVNLMRQYMQKNARN